MRLDRIVPGRPPDNREALVGAVLTRDLVVDGARWSKGRRLNNADLAAFERAVMIEGAPRRIARDGVTVLVPGPDDVHEDEASLRLAAAVRGPGLATRGPAESRIDLVAAVDGVVHVRGDLVERIDRIDALEVFTVFDGQVVKAGDLVGSVKVAPHLVPTRSLARAEAAGVRAGEAGVIGVAGFLPRRVGVVVKESVRGPDRERFEASVRLKVESLGSTIASVVYVSDDADSVERALRPLTGDDSEPVSGRAGEAGRVDVILTAGSASTDPSDAFFVAIDRLGGQIVRRGVPAHPGSMLWVARVGETDLLGLPTCGAYSKATAVDLLLPRLLSGEPADRRTIARLGVGGILTRSMRFRFPAYARELEAPEG